MIRGLYSSSSGMQVTQLHQEVLANNLANVNTTGFKRDLTVAEARGGLAIRRTKVPFAADPLAGTHRVPIGTLGTGAFVRRIHKDLSVGLQRQTEQPLDMALNGPGYFVLQGPEGQLRYSRDGAFTRNAQGQIVDTKGFPLLGEGNVPITLPVGGQVSVSEDGTVVVDGNQVGRIARADFEDPEADLEKIGDTHFAFRGDRFGRAPQVSQAPVLQGVLEGSNVNGVHEMVDMIAAMRQYEANQKAVQMQDETLGKAVNEVAR